MAKEALSIGTLSWTSRSIPGETLPAVMRLGRPSEDLEQGDSSYILVELYWLRCSEEIVNEEM